MLGTMGIPKGKSFSQEQNARVRKAAEALLVTYGGNRTSMARALKLTQAGLSSFLLQRTGAGPQLASAIAEACGMTLTELIQGDEDPRPRLANIPRWPELVKRALDEAPEVPEFCYAPVGRIAADLTGNDQVDVAFIVELARAWFHRSAREQRMAADMQQAARDVGELKQRATARKTGGGKVP
jgi:hypothetical protein